MKDFENKFKDNLITLQQNIDLIKKHTNKKVLLFNLIDNQKPLIDVSPMLLIDENIWEDWEKRAYSGNLVGNFSTFDFKKEFHYKILEMVEYKLINSPIKTKDLKLFLNWITELYILIDVLRLKNLLNLKKIKIYKYESPDFIIETEDNKIIGIEVTLAEDFEESLWFNRNDLNLFNRQDITTKISGYRGISEKNIANIEKHFNKNEIYTKNLKKEFNYINVDILYFIPLGGALRVSKGELEKLKKIKKIAKDNHVALNNVFVQIGHTPKNLFQGINNWFTLEEVIKDLEI